MRTLRILIADDHEEVRWMLTRILSPEGIIVGSVADGRQLISLATTSRPDVIVSDISMPVLTGLEAMGELNASGLAIPFVLISIDICRVGNSAEELIRAGATALVDKMDIGYELLLAVRAASVGQAYFSSAIRSWMLRESNVKDRRPYHQRYCD